MQRFRTRPVVIDAIQYTGKNAAAIAAAFGPSVYSDAARLVCSTLEGEIYASPGDWIVRGAKGEVYPCKPDIFAATYKPVKPTSD